MTKKDTDKSAVIVGGGFAGVGCAHTLGDHGLAVTVVDRHTYHQFQPLLYQVATGMLGSADIARPLREIFRKQETVALKEAQVTEIDPVAKTVTTADGATFAGDYLVLAMGSKPNFFHTPGADKHAFPLYSVTDAERLASRVFELFEEADLDRSLVDRGALNFVIIGGGPTGVETAGALADLITRVMPERYHDLHVQAAQVTLVDAGKALLAPFSDKAHEYAAKILTHKGVDLRLGVRAKEVRDDAVVLTDGTEIKTRCVVWAGGLQAPEVVRAAGLTCGRGGRVQVEADLSVPGFPGVYAAGDIANIPGADGETLPQLGSVALQAGIGAAESILADIEGKPTRPFRYHDKGIMAMIGRGAAIAEMGPHRHELHGAVAFAAWLGVHAWLMSGMRQRVDAFVAWGWDSFGSRASTIDHPDAVRINWDADED